jgi:hypothetical protein
MDNLVGFFGKVEDVQNDPEQLGRVKVRVINHHDTLSVDDLQWMTVGTPTTSPSVQGMGTSPTWLMVGSLVYGMYFDGQARQVPVIMGTIPVIPNRDSDLHSVSKLARGLDSQKSTRGPDIGGAPQYPFNKTITTPGGHVIEIDDTPSNERLVVKHTSGSYIAINKDGDVVVNSAHDSYHLVSGDSTTTVDGDVKQSGKSIKLTSESSFTIDSKGPCKVNSTTAVIISAPKVSIQ